MANYQDILKQIAELQKQAEEIKTREKSSVIKEITEKIAQYGLTAEELGFSSKGGSAAKKPVRKVAVRYRDAAGNTWTGRGKRPSWLVKELANGKSVDDFLVG
ncbi:H-NS histone family protein [Imbroritus primus]|uniref:H-NS histone family protein n=1 Tax=Imbroritus primus TaxID=3058603 RepID=A0ACD3SXU9_9BURK|nr:H-NS histone family protein [Burkholderiaceae bacterium PBA]